MIRLAPDADAVVAALAQQHNVSCSAAAHHLIRVAAGLTPLLPLN